MSTSTHMEDAIEDVQKRLHDTLATLPEKAMAKKYRAKFDGVALAVDHACRVWTELKVLVLGTEDAKKADDERAAEMFYRYTKSNADRANKSIQQFLGNRTELTPKDLDWSDEWFTNVVKVQVATELLGMLDNGTTYEDLRGYIQQSLISTVRSLSSSSSAPRNMTNEYRAKVLAAYLQRIG